MDPIPYIVYEGTMARFERIIRRLWIVCIILILALLGTNAGWLIYQSQFETVESTSVEQDVNAMADDGSDLNLTTVGGDYYGSEGEDKADSNND